MKLVYVLFVLFVIKISSPNDIDELLKPRYDGNNINYSMIVNMKGFIENDYNLDNREIFQKVDDLIGKKIGVVIGTNYNETRFNNATIYNSTQDLFTDLIKHKIDGAIIDIGVGKYVHAFTNEIDIIDERIDGDYLIVFGFQKNNTKYKNEFNDYLASFRSLGSRKDDYGFDDETTSFELEGKNGTLNVTLRLDIPPYAYKMNGENYGTEFLLINTWAYMHGYNINLIEAQSIPEQIELLKNKTCNLAGGAIPMINEYRKDIDYSNVFHPSSYIMSIRYENTIKANTSNKIYNSISDFNGDSLGSLNDNYYQNLTKSKFPNSNITSFDSFYEIYNSLLLEDIHGCILDKPIVDYFTNRYQSRITSYPEVFDQNNYGFGFQKNAEGEKLVKEFNEFLNKTDIDALYYKWTHNKPKDIDIDTNLNTNGKILNVAINMDFIPLGFYQLNDPKGYEYELIYLFAKEYNYQINFTRLDDDAQRMTNLTEGIANITGGHFTITEDRKESIHFSEPILKTSSVLTVRTDSKVDFLTTIVVDENYEEKPNNNIDFKAKFSNATKDASCFFPKQYNDTMLVNCTIYNITDIDPYSQGFEYGNTSDKFNFVYYSFNASTLLKANELIPNISIIKESNKSQSLLSKDNNTDIDAEIKPIKNNYIKTSKKKSLSTGAIIGIIIPSILVLALIAALIFKFSKSNNINENPVHSTSEIGKIKI